MYLHAQGLCDDPRRAVDAAGVSRLIETLGFVQVDTISAVERAHHHILHSRLHTYRQPMLAHLLETDRRMFEHWTHDASIIPLEWFAQWKPRFRRHARRVRGSSWWKQTLGSQPNRTIKRVLDRITREGPLLSRDFEETRSAKDAGAGWWNWKPQKAALEYLWRAGTLSVARRINFQKVYDLTERVHPEHHALPEPGKAEHVHWACMTALDRLGFATASDIAGFWRAIDLEAARAWCAKHVRAGLIVEVNVQSVDPEQPARIMVAHSDWRERLERARSATPPAHLRLLNPFDPLLRDRKRLKRLMNFDYSFEAFTPAAKRRYGYYVLPILRGEKLIGRADATMNRSTGVLKLSTVWWEPKVKATRVIREELEGAATDLAELAGGTTCTLPKSLQ
ncbi:MAG TPA: crosslink repair DNA glycosylase YcaQ family protein [Phycisphaerales bacterium]|nr:crosslink repair DNA glycosylase YcaQ family protein [Phycisphaerales bacterium]